MIHIQYLSRTAASDWEKVIRASTVAMLLFSTSSPIIMDSDGEGSWTLSSALNGEDVSWPLINAKHAYLWLWSANYAECIWV